MKKIVVLVLLVFSQMFPQNKDVATILQKVRENYNKVNDYVVDVHVKLDVSFLKAPESDAKIYFKKPDKMHIESNAFAMLPKNGLSLSPLTLLKENNLSILEREEVIDNVKHYVVKVIPADGNGDIILSTLWIDSKTFSIKKLNGETRNSGKYAVEFVYNDKNSFNLPGEMVFSFNMTKANMPNMRGNENQSESNSKKKEMKGKVFIKYSNYVINKGISDDIFKKK